MLYIHIILSLLLSNAGIDAGHVPSLASIIDICFEFVYLSRPGPGLIISAGVVNTICRSKGEKTLQKV